MTSVSVVASPLTSASDSTQSSLLVIGKDPLTIILNMLPFKTFLEMRTVSSGLNSISKNVWQQWRSYLEIYGKKKITPDSVHKSKYGYRGDCKISKKTGVCSLFGHYTKSGVSSVISETDNFNAYFETMDLCSKRYTKKILAQNNRLDKVIFKANKTIERLNNGGYSTGYGGGSVTYGSRYSQKKRRTTNNKLSKALRGKESILVKMERNNKGVKLFNESNPRPKKRIKTTL
jgi:hypothetical protein